ncbi:pentapeptide repeat-containing protein [Streptomyces sp. NPDC052727]|uniref:pentapeptide repeat-containing protein n=1 Tax=Streptomyces sp. NPDC052727 TaxID=3154854 RepID=UPI0034404768
MTATMPTEPPNYPHCGRGAGDRDPVGCRGRRVERQPGETGDSQPELYAACLTHLADEDRDTYLASLGPGSRLDHRGTTIGGTVLDRLLGAVRDPDTGRPRLGTSQFSGAVFESDAAFDGAIFEGHAQFSNATFNRSVSFAWGIFQGEARFSGAIFASEAAFIEAAFKDDVWFSNAFFKANAWFGGATFEQASKIGPLVCHGQADFQTAVFSTAVTLEIAAKKVDCLRVRWASTAALRLRHATVDLSDAVLEYPVSVAASSTPFTVVRQELDGSWARQELDESGLTRSPVRVLSLRGVDASHLVLADVDLALCRFAGTIHLDQLRLQGRCTLATTPAGLRRRGVVPVRCTVRQTLAEEQHWRAAQGRAGEGWTPDPDGGEPLTPTTLAPVYRELRKAFEDGKNEPGAADFYYGEMEMRRHDPHTSWSERFLLQVYWTVSGYGLRAARALSWLLAAMAATVLLMMLWGLPQESPKSVNTGIIEGRRITVITDTPTPMNPHGPYLDRLSSERFEPALRVVINSVVFRSSGQNLTTFGTYTEMASRFTEPLLLALAVLAIRSRVKR